MNKIGMLITLLAGTLLATQAQAQEPGQSYIGVGGGALWTDGASPYASTLDDRTAAGAKVYVGSLWNEFGMEVALYDLGTYEVNLLGVKIAESHTQAVVVSGVYAKTIGAGFTFHTKLGLVFGQHEIECLVGCPNATLTPTLATTSERGLSGMLSVGFGAKLSHNILVRMDMEHFGGLHHQVSTQKYRDSYDMFSVSLQINF